MFPGVKCFFNKPVPEKRHDLLNIEQQTCNKRGHNLDKRLPVCKRPQEIEARSDHNSRKVWFADANSENKNIQETALMPWQKGFRDKKQANRVANKCTIISPFTVMFANCQWDYHCTINMEYYSRFICVLFGNPLQNICKCLRALYLLYAVWVEIYTLKSHKRHNEAKGSFYLCKQTLPVLCLADVQREWVGHASKIIYCILIAFLAWGNLGMQQKVVLTSILQCINYTHTTSNKNQPEYQLTALLSDVVVSPTFLKSADMFTLPNTVHSKFKAKLQSAVNPEAQTGRTAPITLLANSNWLVDLVLRRHTMLSPKNSVCTAIKFKLPDILA
ncbi:hypothetical protein PROFUN_16333 [Planoprotostelium fungivorum]|uniref:Uncharacterized protein n=1 Tax=Planoprotostelium fungivorum TaxID=1890364 RepID=A0A2P6MR65_9EUKA|nr:hypothetical protein PROFUN_16333 [Planoprotostelium fungivorum]